MYVSVHRLDQLGLEVLYQMLPAQVQYGRGLIAKLREAGEIVVFNHIVSYHPFEFTYLSEPPRWLAGLLQYLVIAVGAQSFPSTKQLAWLKLNFKISQLVCFLKFFRK